GRSRDIEGLSQYESAYDVVRTQAALRGGNYVVIDLVTAARTPSGSSDSVSIQGRLFACTLGYPAALPARPVAMTVEPEPAQVAERWTPPPQPAACCPY